MKKLITISARLLMQELMEGALFYSSRIN